MTQSGSSLLAAVALTAATALTPALADQPKFKADPPASILTPDEVQTSVGTLHFKDGAPDEKTVQLALDQLDLGRGIETFMKGMPATSVWAACSGLASAGVKENGGVGITEDLMDARTLFLTPNTTTPYVFACLNLTAGPMVLEIPPGVLGPVDDAYFRWVVDLGLTGPDQGRGGRYLFLPPGYDGPVPSMGFHVVRPKTNRLLMFFRAFVKDGDLKGAVDNVTDNTKLYPLADFGKPHHHDLRQHLGQAVQHHQRQHLRVLQRAEPGGAERARRFRRSRDRGPVRRHRHPQGPALPARCAHDEDPHRCAWRWAMPPRAPSSGRRATSASSSIRTASGSRPSSAAATCSWMARS